MMTKPRRSSAWKPATGGIDARDHHAADRLRDLQPSDHAAIQLADGQAERRLCRLGLALTRPRPQILEAVRRSLARRTLGELDLHALVPAVAHDVEPRDASRLARRDVANHLFVVDDLTPLDLDDDVVGLQAGALGGRAAA